MRILNTIPSVAVAAASALLATSGLQAQVIATPVGLSLETVEGHDQLSKGWGGYTVTFGGYASGRYQLCDDELTDNKVRAITSLAFRHDYRNYSTSSGGGRKWSNVTLTMNELPYASLSSTFANNQIQATTMHSGAVTWPTMNGSPTTKPAPMDPGLKFPFTTVFIHTGTNAILTDMTFTGGTLANGAAWTGNSSYYLDGLSVIDNMYSGASTFPTPDNGCNDSAVTGTAGATMLSGYNQFSLPNPTKSNTIEIPVYSRYTAPNAPLFHALGVQGSTTGGIQIGAGCNTLILDFSIPVIILGVTAGALPNAETPRLTLVAPRTAANLAVEVWTQGAWADSATGQFSLTRATRAKTPNLGMCDIPPKKRMVYRTGSTTSTTGTLGTETNWTLYPITFYGL